MRDQQFHTQLAGFQTWLSPVLIQMSGCCFSGLKPTVWEKKKISRWGDLEAFLHEDLPPCRRRFLGIGSCFVCYFSTAFVVRRAHTNSSKWLCGSVSKGQACLLIPLISSKVCSGFIFRRFSVTESMESRRQQRPLGVFCYLFSSCGAAVH